MAEAVPAVEGLVGNPDDREFVSTGVNLWKSLGRPDAEEYFVKVQLAGEICTIVQESDISLRKLAKQVGIEFSRLSEVANGKLKGYTVDRLIEYLNLLGRDVEIVVKTKPVKANRPARTTVRK